MSQFQMRAEPVFDNWSPRARIIGAAIPIPLVGFVGFVVLAMAGSCGTNAPCVTPADNAFLVAFAAAVLFVVLLLVGLLGVLVVSAVSAYGRRRDPSAAVLPSPRKRSALWVYLLALLVGPFVVYSAVNHLLMGQARADCNYVESCMYDDGD